MHFIRETDLGCGVLDHQPANREARTAAWIFWSPRRLRRLKEAFGFGSTVDQPSR
jgi:hypothetical protein